MTEKRLSSRRTALQARKTSLAVLALLLAAGYVAIGQQAPPAAPVAARQPTAAPQRAAAKELAAAKEPAAAGAAAGLKAYIDPVTGQLRPAEQEEMQQPEPASLALQPANQLAAPAPEPQTFRHPSGAIGLRVGPEQMVFSVATIGADGKLRYECVQGESAAQQKLNTARQGGLDVR